MDTTAVTKQNEIASSIRNNFLLNEEEEMKHIIAEQVQKDAELSQEQKSRFLYCLESAYDAVVRNLSVVAAELVERRNEENVEPYNEALAEKLQEKFDELRMLHEEKSNLILEEEARIRELAQVSEQEKENRSQHTAASNELQKFMKVQHAKAQRLEKAKESAIANAQFLKELFNQCKKEAEEDIAAKTFINISNQVHNLSKSPSKKRIRAGGI